ncbi:MAG: ferrous iron transporter B, partial [Spirochaetia bacterium]|nr:ferrous iron transporter B [Spirochaetia bacterium]
QSIYTWAAPIMDFIESMMGELGDFISPYFAEYPVLQSLAVDGVIGGVGAVIIFIPQIAILFTFIAVLEDSGYLSRAAFLMDKLLGWTGLNGRSFIPMLSGFACAVPSVMSTRVIPDFRVRLATIMIVPLMSCSARLPVYLLFIGAFIEPAYGPVWAAVSLFGMHIIGPIIALPVAYLLNQNILKSQAAPFVLEMPAYRIPKLYNVLYRVYEAVTRFLVRAGTVIFAMSILIWALSYFPRPESVENNIRDVYAEKISLADEDSAAVLEVEMENRIASAYLEQSYLGKSGKLIQPVFSPLGFDWKLSVGILGAFPAREVIISTLGIIYNVGSSVSEESSSLREKMLNEKNEDGSALFSLPVVLSLMVFFALCSQCMSTLATVKKELHSWKWTIFQFVYMTLLAYIAGLLIYQIGKFFI